MPRITAQVFGLALTLVAYGFSGEDAKPSAVQASSIQNEASNGDCPKSADCPKHADCSKAQCHKHKMGKKASPSGGSASKGAGAPAAPSADAKKADPQAK